MKKTNQCELVLEYLREKGSITTFESYNQLFITRLASRISDLRKKGFEFDEEWVTKKNWCGRTISFKKYKLKSEGAL